jgi:CHC2 zinc finger
MRILCPHHEERTPSCMVYPSGWAHCFGCGANFQHGKVETAGELEPPEDLTISLAAIKGLPLKPVRGLELPADDRSFYIVWDDGQYYKRRFTMANAEG